MGRSMFAAHLDYDQKEFFSYGNMEELVGRYSMRTRKEFCTAEVANLNEQGEINGKRELKK